VKRDEKWDEMALVGRIARAHGIRGQVIVNPETDFPEDRFRPGAELFIERAGRIEALRVRTSRFHGARPIIGIEGVETMNDAETLAGCELRVPVGQLAALPADTFYRHDLVGCVVETRDGRRVGPVTDVEGSMTGSRLVVDGGAGEVLIPLVAAICTVVDPAAKRIVIDPPAGLLEANEGSS
jgi:16S rRNA processing protein RimM